MIINQQNEYFEVFPFIENMNRAVKGLVRIEIGSGKQRGTSSGWMITDDLVMIPDFVGQKDNEFSVFISMENTFEKVPAKKVSYSSASKVGEGMSILKLPTAFTGRALELDVRMLVSDDQVCILQHPEGNKRPMFSLGRILNILDIWLNYDANTSPGSSGSPVLSLKTWKVAGMHVKGDPTQGNSGLTISCLLDQLRSTEVWNEIATFHGIADTTGNRTTQSNAENQIKKVEVNYKTNDALMAALSWSFDSKKLSEEAKKNVKSFVVDPGQTEWRLKSVERQRILKYVKPSNIIKPVPTLWRSMDDTAQKVIDRILKGGPFNLDEASEDELPYWLQAVRWFDGTVKDLPTAAEVNSSLERKRIRSRLENISAGFFGRANELGEISKWMNDDKTGPLLLTGIGGMGKSALIAYFARSLSPGTLLIWLDFDRPDIAPDDPVSILNAIAKQAVLQLPGLKVEEIMEKSWQEGANALTKSINSLTSNQPLPLLVLDGFEIAQYVTQHFEIWPVLDLIILGIPGIKIIISGRAPVKPKNIGGQPVTPMVLNGFSNEDSKIWLKQQSITDDSVLQQVVDLAAGIPLRLKLAVRLIKSGASIKELPQDLPKILIEGYLYQRILDRLIDPSVIHLAKDLLILRKCSYEMFKGLFLDKLPEGSSSEEVYEKVSREIALVGETENLSASFIVSTNKQNMLELRPEVRMATLRLLEMDDAANVKKVDQQAISWYANTDLSDLSNLSEYIYHLLRIDNVSKVRTIWKPDCALMLKNAVNELPEASLHAREWLFNQIGDFQEESSYTLEVWETQTVKEIRNRLSRGMYTGLSSILGIRTERSVSSPLLVYDTFDLMQQGELDKALTKISDQATDALIEKERSILRAYLLNRKGRGEEADYFLSRYEHEENWTAFQDRKIISLGLRAARIRLNVDLKTELELLEQHTDSLKDISSFLSPSDMLLADLQPFFQRYAKLESYESGIAIPTQENQLSEFIFVLQQKRLALASLALPIDKDLQHVSIEDWRAKLISNVDLDKDLLTRVFDLALKGYRRWRLACKDLMLYEISKIVNEKKGSLTPLELSVFATLFTYRGEELDLLSNEGYPQTLNECIMDFIKESPKEAFPVLNLEQIEILKERYFGFNLKDVLLFINRIFEGLTKEQYMNKLDIQSILFISKMEKHHLLGFLFYFLSPDPLEIICKKVLQLPTTYKFNPNESIA